MNDTLVKSLHPKLSAQHVEQRVLTLLQNQILLIGDDHINDDELTLVNFEPSQRPITGVFGVSMNFSLQHYRGKWLYWNANKRCWVLLNSNHIEILSQYIINGFSDKFTSYFASMYSIDELQGLVSGFVGQGLLIPLKKKACELTENSISEKLPGIALSSDQGWKTIQPDERIPVYFVPHMKNHYPLALGVLFSALENHNGGSLTEKFQLVPICYMKPNEFLNGPYRKFRQGVWLFSNYMWSLDINMQISEAIKKQDSRNLTIHGGPSTPEYAQASQDFMAQFTSVDISVHGEGEVAIIEILDKIYKNEHGKTSYDETDLFEVSGITYRSLLNPHHVKRTSARKRTAQPDFAPSPYLSGYFAGYGAEVDAAIIESNRGCPFGCTFCDWGSATNQKVRKFDLERVKQEIDWIAKNKVRVLWIADANYGLYDRDIELSQHIVDTKAKTGYPQEVVVNYTKNSTWRLVEIIKIFTAGGIISQGIISIQTTDDKTLEVINRKNIKTEKYDELTKVFYDLKLPLSTDLMLGLPGITVEAFNKDLQRYIDMDVSVKAYPTQLLPNSPMADPEYIEKYQIKTDKNDFLIASFSYTEQDLHWMKGMYHMYTIADGYGLLRYVIRYLQWEHGIRAVDFISDLLKFVNGNPGQYNKITWAVRYFINDKCMPGGWHNFYAQIGEYITATYGIEMDSGFETVFTVSEVSMPDDTIRYPVERNIAHDFTAYFTAKTQNTDHAEKPLDHYPPSRFHVSDPNNMVAIDMNYMQYDSHQYFWELHSDVARPKSTSEFVDNKLETV
ncbi:B12-binding domain-containing radical SAM protein [Marinicella rhabdoformis]|uniref:B12-binding domain-containing radical SAM protein n=1 Tax=Marinicella rhabdoformis TaxID=2580566 RepID=UPI0015D0C144|nr:radical SAM protein [Marinicella rhabdoformis]